MTMADVPLIGSWVSTLVTVPLYLFIWKASASFSEISQTLKAHTEAIEALTGKLLGHDGRLTELEIEAAREEGRREKKPWNGNERRERRTRADE